MNDTFATELARALGSTVIIPAGEGDIGSMKMGMQVLPHYKHSDSDAESESEELYLQNTDFSQRIVYRPLKANEIRLLVLNPGLSDDPIECFLEHYPVNQSKSYQALSYVWGTSIYPDPIRVGGFSFHVTENLHSFLKMFRKEYKTEVLWIDAICIGTDTVYVNQTRQNNNSIDQNNIPERNAQIKQMKRVYEGAESVVIWLGNEDTNTSEAFNHLNHLYDTLWLPSMDRHDLTQGPLSSLTSKQVPLLFAGPSDSARAWNGIEDIFKRPWWSRIWVYQEATAPAENGSVVICGRHTMEFTKILVVNKIVRNMISRFEGLSRLEHCNSLNAVYMDVYSELRRSYQETGTTSYLRLADLLPVLRGYAATNPRDKLYALIPTSIDGDELLDVDYELPVDEVYTNAALSLIRQHRNLDILGHCTRPEMGSMENLPSWVPNWISSSSPVHFFKRGRVIRSTNQGVSSSREEIGKLYSASGDTEAQTYTEKVSKALFVKGFFFDKIQFVSATTGCTHDGSVGAKDWIEWLDSLHCPPGMQEAMRKALPRVLVADTYRVGVDVGTRGCTQQSVGSDLYTESLPSANALGQSDIHEGVTGPHPATFRRRLIMTEQGYLGLTAEHVKVDDAVAICLGGQLPFILRRVLNYYTLIGEAYIHGIMDGEAMIRHNTSGSASFETIEIR
jgi:hypothetical protein